MEILGAVLALGFVQPHMGNVLTHPRAHVEGGGVEGVHRVGSVVVHHEVADRSGRRGDTHKRVKASHRLHQASSVRH